MPAHAPYLPFAIPVGNGSIGWEGVISDRCRYIPTFPASGVSKLSVNPSEDEREKPARLSVLKKIGQPLL
jgi:hypothetical protein